MMNNSLLFILLKVLDYTLMSHQKTKNDGEWRL